MPMETMKLTFVNVGYGEAIVAECPDPGCRDGTFVLVIDGGGAERSEFADRSTGRMPLAEYLERRGIGHIDCMVATHIHEDHTCGLLPAAKALAPAVLWQTLPETCRRAADRPLEEGLAQTDSQSKFLRALNDYRRLCALVEERHGALRTMGAGDCGELCPGLRYQVLAPSAAQAAELEALYRALYRETEPAAFLQKLSDLDARMNNFSLMLLLDHRGTRLLLPGDTNVRGYAGVPREALRAHLFKVGHHGQRDGADETLAEAVRPEAVVCCASSDRRYDSADPGVLGLLRAAGAALYFSDCPSLPGLCGEVPSHRALEFTVGEGGALEARYRDV